MFGAGLPPGVTVTAMAWRTVVVSVSVIISTSAAAHAYGVGPAVPLEELAKKADLVCKGVVVADRKVRDPWFEATPGFEARETTLSVVSCIKGKKPKQLRFRHYAAGPPAPRSYTPPNFTFVVGRAYVVFAAKGTGGAFRVVSKSPTRKIDPDAILAADTKPHRGTTVTEAVWSEQRGLIASADAADVIAGIRELDELSGGRMLNLADFERGAALAEIAVAIGHKDSKVATAAIDVFGADSPYYEDRDAKYWLAGLGKGRLSGLGSRKAAASPAAGLATPALLAVADSGSTPALRALAIRALGQGSSVPAATIASWSRDPDVEIRRAVTLTSAARSDRLLITSGAKDPAPEIRAAAALAIGFTQDPKLLPLLPPLLTDPARDVHTYAAMSLLSFSIDQSAPALRQGLNSPYRSLFVNALASRDPRPYLRLLAEIIIKHEQPAHWWGGSVPAGESWNLLFGYVKAQAVAELTSGKLDASLDALEQMQWFSSAEPRDLYALYVARNLTVRAGNFRAAMKTSNFDLAKYFDEVDQNPARFKP